MAANSRPKGLAKAVFLKELRETFRDKRVILGVIVSPLLITPLLIATISFFMVKKTMDMQTTQLDIGLLEEAGFVELTNSLEKEENLTLSRFDALDSAKKALESRATRAVLIVGRTARDAYLRGESAELEILYNQSNENSENAKNRLRKFLSAFDEQSIGKRLESKGFAASFIQPTAITETSLASKESKSGFILGMFLPYIVVMGAAFGGITTAFDLCAGEKERGTMETLLVSPASRYEIVQGKLFTICVISIIAAFCSIAGFIVPIQSGLAIFKDVIKESISISYPAIGAMLLIVIPLSAFTSSLLLLISSFARNQKEAQAYVFPFMVIMIVPAMLSSVFGAESALFTAFIPVLNIALTMKQILGGVFQLPYFCIALATSLIYALVAMRIAVSFFQRESILFRT